MRLLQRFYSKDSGTILIDGHQIEDLDVHHFRRAVSIVPQDVVLFDKTIKENLKYGAGGDPTDAEIIAACRQANAWEFIEKKPDGLETRVGARSVANADDLHLTLC